jgi:hypothetical protein
MKKKKKNREVAQATPMASLGVEKLPPWPKGGMFYPILGKGWLFIFLFKKKIV